MAGEAVTIGRATLYLGDCRAVIGSLQNIACVLTDPPFGIGYKSGHATDALWVGGDTIAHDECTTARDEAIQMLGEVPMLVFGSRRAPLPPKHKMTLIWDKGPALGMGDLSIPWKPSYEEIYAINRGFVGTRDKGAVIYHPPVQSMAKNGREHPNQKPVGLLKLLMRSLPEGTVCDPFMGSGSTGVAALQSGRSFVGCEINPEYFAIARRRIAEASGDDAGPLFGEAA